MKTANHIPRYRRQKRTKGNDRAFVEFDHTRHYLGIYGSPESREQYARLIAEWGTTGCKIPEEINDITVIELLAHFWKYAQTYYCRADCTITQEVDNYRQAMRPIKELYGHTLAKDFGPRALRTVRQTMIDRNLARTNINKMVSRVRRIFKWGTEYELVRPEVYYGLQAVAGLKRGRSKARETEPVKPVPEEHIDAIKPNSLLFR